MSSTAEQTVEQYQRRLDKAGGYAFPHSAAPGDSGVQDYGQDGMTLREWFAGQALAGGLEQGTEHDMADGTRDAWWHSPEKIARRAYNIADAMLAEGKRRW